MNSIITKTSIEGFLVIENPFHKDSRGFYHEIAQMQLHEELLFQPKQWNHSFSKPGVLRGLHASRWNKLIYPLNGTCFVAVADVREDSKTFGCVETLTIRGDKPKAIFVAKGIANSFCVIGSKPLHYLYLVDEYYQNNEVGIAWNDADLNIRWPIKDPILSDKDQKNPVIRDLFPEQFKKTKL
jgi:dTDP-4-dehydrorhamnose 3,5-epimerase